MRQWMIDAFTSRAFGGNAACILEPLSAWPDAAWMQGLAGENNVGATAFLRRTEMPSRFGLRWFTPAVEVPLCGHATLAAAHMLFAEAGLGAEALEFETLSGELCVQRSGDAYEMTLPAQQATPIPTPPELVAALGVRPTEVWAGAYLVAIFETADEVRALEPRHEALRLVSLAHGGQGNVGAAAPAEAGSAFDVIDRFFAPGYGIPEDAATGSFHGILTPIFAGRFKAGPIRFHQAYPGRGAELEGRVEGDRVTLRGKAFTVSEARLRVAP
ncbi:PhzF family phenazine biosynthesis protein [Phenylobacterium sp.]|uniref:PhzF family phenazine biosynthesis protein n=1 Tax=Phenylobacterium sp. TaxID=1871053 RepID=UPI002FCB0566